MSAVKHRITPLRLVALGSTSLALLVPLASTPLSGPAAALACTSARIGGVTKCLQRGEYCAKAQEKAYERYGFHCTKKDKNGRWHLQ